LRDQALFAGVAVCDEIADLAKARATSGTASLPEKKPIQVPNPIITRDQTTSALA